MIGEKQDSGLVFSTAADNRDERALRSRSSWYGHKNPRIVRVSRLFGGKDRHSKVTTVRGLRDRRVRLSVPTAIQLYDLQDRLGLGQPSKVVDWLLNAAQHEIDKLPPLLIPPCSALICSSPPISSVSRSDDHSRSFQITSKFLSDHNGASNSHHRLSSTDEEIFDNIKNVSNNNLGSSLRRSADRHAHWNFKQRESMIDFGGNVGRSKNVAAGCEGDQQGLIRPHSSTSVRVSSANGSDHSSSMSRLLMNNFLPYASHYQWDTSSNVRDHEAAQEPNIQSSSSNSSMHLLPGSHQVVLFHQNSSSDPDPPNIIAAPDHHTGSKKQLDCFQMATLQHLSSESLRNSSGSSSTSAAMRFFESNLAHKYCHSQNQNIED